MFLLFYRKFKAEKLNSIFILVNKCWAQILHVAGPPDEDQVVKFFWTYYSHFVPVVLRLANCSKESSSVYSQLLFSLAYFLPQPLCGFCLLIYFHFYNVTCLTSPNKRPSPVSPNRRPSPVFCMLWKQNTKYRMISLGYNLLLGILWVGALTTVHKEYWNVFIPK